MKNLYFVMVLVIFSLGLSSCGKRGDLLPPEGYEAPKENQ